MENKQPFIVRVATADDARYAEQITEEMAASAKARGTGIARRSPEYIRQKMEEGKAVIAVTPDGQWVGFCYIEAWSHGKFVANSGLIVSPPFRGSGAAKAIKRKIFELSRQKYPEAKIFGLTTTLAVMKINSELGYVPVTYSELTDDDEFWKGCQSCVNYEILMSKNRKNCLCTAMLFDPAAQKKKEAETTTAAPAASTQRINGKKRRTFAGNWKLFERWLRFKRYVLLKPYRKKDEAAVAGGPVQEKRKFFLDLF
ncbi:GNAT family N-acetyltransferase [Thermoflavifilum thermophilum]|uniref:N-acetyltransferase domain-containing protein n=1 Tax=Thermoflavifilum thermophilum TaxID=1393122 RepID=A0A1I7NK61_9BACT|nr:GNAT family N-acetyltransferase [Thermoflavifilum thermophilum]SFV35043.1 hypothetical protein SAMN05660895_2144 [Thermoflavifilum thermophilum]